MEDTQRCRRLNRPGINEAERPRMERLRYTNKTDWEDRFDDALAHQRYNPIHLQCIPRSPGPLLRNPQVLRFPALPERKC